MSLCVWWIWDGHGLSVIQRISNLSTYTNTKIVACCHLVLVVATLSWISFLRDIYRKNKNVIKFLPARFSEASIETAGVAIVCEQSWIRGRVHYSSIKSDTTIVYSVTTAPYRHWTTLWWCAVVLWPFRSCMAHNVSVELWGLTFTVHILDASASITVLPYVSAAKFRCHLRASMVLEPLC